MGNFFPILVCNSTTRVFLSGRLTWSRPNVAALNRCPPQVEVTSDHHENAKKRHEIVYRKQTGIARIAGKIPVVALRKRRGAFGKLDVAAIGCCLRPSKTGVLRNVILYRPFRVLRVIALINGQAATGRDLGLVYSVRIRFGHATVARNRLGICANKTNTTQAR